jgi:glycosyltransferase involved in cell wall biosynthesis
MPATTPEVAVAVGSHDRALRLRWLLNALEDQTIARDRFEVIVGHDSQGSDTDELLATHPLARDGTLRVVRLDPGSAPPGYNRNAAWRAARAPVIAFTDDDCRPPADWLERLLAAVRANPGAVIQGRTAADPEELVTLENAPAHTTHTQRIEPPTPWAECCNIAYPRAVLEELDGFADATVWGEDTDLACRAQKLGAPYIGAPEVLTFHAVTENSVINKAKGVRRWQWLPLMVKRHPELREHFTARYFMRASHAWLPFAVLGLILGRRRPLLGLALVTPWIAQQVQGDPGRGNLRGALRLASELPGRAVIDGTEFASLAYGSARHRSLLI